MMCSICGYYSESEHEISPMHMKNKILFEYSLNKKQFVGNRKGINVNCDVTSTYAHITGCSDAACKISAKPNEVIQFNFNITNEMKKEELVVVGIQMAHSKYRFTMNQHGCEFGSPAHILKPKQSVPREINVVFISPDVGQYEMPVLFVFIKPITNEPIIIIREMIVFVENTKTAHEKQPSPYKDKLVVAEKLIRTTAETCYRNMFPIPYHYKKIYASGLNLGSVVTSLDSSLVHDLQAILDIGVTKENYRAFFHHLLWYEETILRINLKKYNMSSVPMERCQTGFKLHVPGLAEKRPSLLTGDFLLVKYHDDLKKLYEGVIVKIECEFLYISGLQSSFEDYFVEGALFDVSFRMSRLCIERMHYAVQNIMEVNQGSRIFPKDRRNHRNVPAVSKYFNKLVSLNNEQRTAVEHILAQSSGLAPYMVHGPPGTGKTMTIVEAILQIVKQDTFNRVLVCTDSNMAADHVASVLIQYQLHFTFKKNFLIRVNSQHRVWETMPKVLVPFSNGSSTQTFFRMTTQDLQCYHIVVATLSHSAKFICPLDKDGYITHLFIDEAAQASEPVSLIPIVGLLSNMGQLVLAGDPKQLGPVIISHDVKRKGLGTSLMERLNNTCDLYDSYRNDVNFTVMLRNNFRSHPDILDIPNQLFYDNQLRAHATLDPLSLIDVLGEQNQSRGIVFHGVRSKEQRIGKSPSFFNSMEVELIQNYIKCLIVRLKVNPEDIGVVTPYMRQVYKVKQWLESSNFGNSIEVGTVEAFQGKEKRIIIISTVRANCALFDYDAKYQLGFLVDDKRFNVALTRAKAKVIVIGNPLCLVKDTKWRLYIKKCKELGTYFGFDMEREQNDDAQKELLCMLRGVLDNLSIDPNKK